MYLVNRLPKIQNRTGEITCCNLIDPLDWDQKHLTFQDKLFVHVRTRSILHMPINMNSVMQKTMQRIEEYGAAIEDENFVMLTDDTSGWYSDHYIAVAEEVPGLEHERLSGEYITKVFEGPYRDAGKWYSQLIDYVFSLGYEPLKTYFFYTACPKCAKKFGKNYVVGFEQIK